jgi:hypothetical protein
MPVRGLQRSQRGPIQAAVVEQVIGPAMPWMAGLHWDHRAAGQPPLARDLLWSPNMMPHCLICLTRAFDLIV